MAQTAYLLKNLTHRRFMAALGPGVRVDAPALEAYAALLRTAGAILEEGDRQLARHGLSQGRLRLLIQLKLEGEKAPADIAQAIGVSRATVTGLLNRLEADRMIRRKPSPSDRRSLTVRLSPGARRLIAALLPRRARRVSRLLSTLSDADKKQMTALLAKIEAALAKPRRRR
ncbi:MAG: MarR family transcriptional regulator [Elusimicrobia bacterium]|nr:MarR family transcriptional regulator [Elusimicrobiota bacterium]MDE2425302.1 MarR family transcriptional regulator [Elusimicrobiota bacterium]